jgi:hypothetical protein
MSKPQHREDTGTVATTAKRMLFVKLYSKTEETRRRHSGGESEGVEGVSFESCVAAQSQPQIQNLGISTADLYKLRPF